MIIYRIKLKIQKAKEKEWYEWLIATHIPNVINTRHFLDFSVFKFIWKEIPAEDYSFYEFQFFCRSLEELEIYRSNEELRIDNEQTQLFGMFIKGIEQEILEDVTESTLAEL